MAKTKYNEQCVGIAEKYYKECIRKDITPYLNKLARRLSISLDTLNEWSKSDSEYYKKDLSVIIKRIKQLIEERLQEIVLGERKGHVIGAMFRLKAQHGYMETSKQINEGSPTTIVVADTGYNPLKPSHKSKQQPVKPS